MKITSSAVQNGFIEDKYGKRGTEFSGSMPTYSWGFQVENAPKGTKTFAFILDDEDARPVAGFTWIHWLGANLKETFVPENASLTASNFIQGQNSWRKNLYGGMAPPNAPHRYDLHVYALDTELPLKEGFSREELEEAMRGHILSEAVLSGIYNN